MAGLAPLTTALEDHLRPHPGSTHAQILYGLRLAAVELLIERWVKEGVTHFGIGNRPLGKQGDHVAMLTNDVNTVNAAWSLTDPAQRLEAQEVIVGFAVLGEAPAGFRSAMHRVLAEHLATTGQPLPVTE